LDSIKKELRQQSRENYVVLTLDFQVSDNTRVKWETVVYNKKMYVQVPNGILPEGSKEAFVSLLEFSEELLECECIVVCFNKNRGDRAHLVRTFMFLGFAMLPPGHDLIPSGSSNETLFMAYTTG